MEVLVGCNASRNVIGVAAIGLALTLTFAAPERPREEIEQLERMAAAWVDLDGDDACVERLEQSWWDHVELFRVALRYCRDSGSRIVALADDGGRSWTLRDPDSSPQEVLDAIFDVSRADPVMIRDDAQAADYMTVALELIFDRPGLAVVGVVGFDGVAWHGVANIPADWGGTSRIVDLETDASGRLRLLGVRDSEDGDGRPAGIAASR
jgi:hypothetical protein